MRISDEARVQRCDPHLLPCDLKFREGANTIVDQATHNKIVSFIWGIADDVLRDLFKRGK